MWFGLMTKLFFNFYNWVLWFPAVIMAAIIVAFFGALFFLSLSLFVGVASWNLLETSKKKGV